MASERPRLACAKAPRGAGGRSAAAGAFKGPRAHCRAMPPRVLVADDDRTHQRLCAHLVAQALPGAVVDVVSSGEEALARLRAQPYDLVLSDHAMGWTSGL